ncbi:MAG: hypothetical protein ACREXT_10445 [Gammaproteobacteria bacterium]
MKESRLQAWLCGARERVIWLEYDRYAHRVFANAAQDWWRNATRFATTMIQAHRAIPSEVLTIDIAQPGFASATDAGDPVSTCKRALQDPASLRFIHEVCDALAHQLDRQCDLVLRVPAPADLLRLAGQEGESSFDDLDEIGTQILSLVRPFAEKPLAGLLLTRAAEFPLSADEQDAYAPLARASRHYGWVSCLQYTEPSAATANDWTDLDLVLCTELTIIDLLRINAPRRKFGGGLPHSSWAGGQNAAASGLLFGTIPREGNPEQIFARCADLRVEG